MGKNTRYNALRNSLAREFSANRTYSITTAAGDRELLFNAGDPDSIGNDSFLTDAPFNFVEVRNFGDADARVYFNSNRELYVDVPAVSGAVKSLQATAVIPKRYVGFLEVENLSGTNALDLEIQVGNTVDGIEFDLLQMSGLLDVNS